jgi:glutaredoxin
MRKEKFVTMGVLIFIFLIAGGIIFFKNFQGSTVQDLPSEKVAKWIGEHSVLYVQTGCSHCIDQENLFGINVKHLTIVDCINGEGLQKCIDAGIGATPTWIIDGQKYAGVQTIEKLKQLTGYKE